MKYKKTAVVVAGALLALGAGSTADAAQPDSHSTDEVGRLLASTGDIVNVLRQGSLHRDGGTLVKRDPKNTKLSIAGIPLGLSTPD